MTPLAIVVRILSNPLANVFQKQLTQRSAHPIFIIAAVHTVLAVACLPYCFLPGTLNLAPAVWTNMIVAAVLAVAGNVLLVYALSETDLSILGPINAYKSVVGLVLGVFLVGERPTPTGLAGVLLIVAGSYFVIDGSNQPVHPPTRSGAPAEQSGRMSNAFVRFFRQRGVQLRFAALFFSATEALFEKRAIVLSSPAIVFVLWSGLGCAIAAAWTVVVLRRQLRGQLVVLRGGLGTFVWLVVATATMQLATVFTFRALQVGYSLALFQLSAIVSVFLGRHYFAETNIRERLIGSVIMVAGAALIVIFGHGR